VRTSKTAVGQRTPPPKGESIHEVSDQEERDDGNIVGGGGHERSASNDSDESSVFGLKAVAKDGEFLEKGGAGDDKIKR
jgi:hypothetical protein